MIEVGLFFRFFVATSVPITEVVKTNRMADVAPQGLGIHMRSSDSTNMSLLRSYLAQYQIGSCSTGEHGTPPRCEFEEVEISASEVHSNSSRGATYL